MNVELGLERSYKCKGASNKVWIRICAHCPETAAMVYAEENGLDRGDIVSIWGIGKFKVNYIFNEPIYEMIQITGRHNG